MDQTRWAARGETIETQVQFPTPTTLTARLDTAEACAYGNELIASGRWKVHEWCEDAKCTICSERRKAEKGQ